MMWRYYLKIARRSLWKHKFYTALNIFGLSLGMAGGLVLYRYISFHLSYDRYHQRAGQLYRVVTDLHLDDGSVINEVGSPLPLTAALQETTPAVRDQAVLLKLRSVAVAVPGAEAVPGAGATKLFSEAGNTAFTAAHWFHLFDYTWKEGNPETALKSPNQAVITRRLAKKYFGDGEAIGRSIRLNDKYLVTVTGVLEDYPPNTDMRTDLFLSRSTFNIMFPAAGQMMEQSWSMINSTTNSFVWLPDGLPADRLDGALNALVKAHFSPDVVAVYRFHLQPLSEIHFDGRYDGSMRKSLLFTLAAVGLFLVLIACFNFINLATAQNARRAKEIGTRKVLGGRASGIFWQFMAESLCIALLAIGLSFLWIRLSQSLLNSWLQVPLDLNFLQDKGFLLCILLLPIGVILVSGLYPALLLSRFRPVDALKKEATGLRAGLYRKGLIVVQNVVVQVLIICTLLITLQVRYLKTADLGFDKNEVLMTPLPEAGAGKLAYLAQQLGRNPAIRHLSFCAQAPSSQGGNSGSISYDDRHWENFVAGTIVADTGYLNTFGLQLLAGRNMQPADSVKEILVNATMVNRLGIRDPQQVIGHRLVVGALGDQPGIIVGVVKDFNVHALYTPMEPVLITTMRAQYTQAAIKLDGPGARDAVRQVWESVYPGRVFEYHFLNEQIDEFYHKEDLLSKLINATVAIAIVISCLGLLGLISFFANQRAKEIGVRKILGAGIPSIVYLLSRDFLKLVLLSMGIATPLAWWFMHRWLQDFAYRIDISWWIFALAGLVSLVIAMLTVGYQALRAALANPVESLRD